MQEYKMELDVAYFDCDHEKNMKATAILKYLSEISIRHNNQNPKSKKLEAEGFGWMINRWQLDIDSYPRAEDRIGIRTWVSRIDRFFVRRDYLIQDQMGKVLARASSLWIFIDMEKRRPARLSEAYIDFPVQGDKELFPFQNLEALEEVSAERNFYIRRDDIDTNRHVNNVKYLDWILEAIDDTIYKNYNLREFQIEYKKEIVYPSEILSRNFIEYKNKDNSEIIIRQEITSKDGEELKALASSKWLYK